MNYKSGFTLCKPYKVASYFFQKILAVFLISIVLCGRRPKRMRNKIGLFTLAACVLCSCGDRGGANARVYGPFGSMTALQVENACKSYAERGGNASYADCVFLMEELAVFDNVYVDLLKMDIGRFGMAVPEVCENVVLYDTYICYLPNPSYDLNVYVDGDGSYSLKNAYDKGIIDDENVKSIIDGAERCHLREGGPHNMTLETFSFSLAWGYGPEHFYDSKTKVLIKDLYPNTSELTKEDYTTSFIYPNMEDLYTKVTALSIYSYPTDFDAYEGTQERTQPAYKYRLEVGDKTINAYDCPSTVRLPEGLMPKGKAFLTLVFEIIDTIQNSDEWESLPDQKPRYM